MLGSYKRLRYPLLWGLLFLALGGFKLLDDHFFFKNAVRDYGTIVHAESYTRRASTVWDLDIKFKLLQNDKETVSHLKTVDGIYSEGGDIRFFYDPAKPDDIRLDDPWDRWFAGIAYLVIGFLPLLLIGLHRFHALLRKTHWDPWRS